MCIRDSGKGIAIANFQGSICAIVLKISFNSRKKIKIYEANCVIDLGRYVNPDIVKAQCEGCIVKGISVALYEEITFSNGKVDQSNYDDYKIAQMKNSPIINVRIIESNDHPEGADAALPPTIPALANAIFDATGKRFRKLPIRTKEFI